MKLDVYEQVKRAGEFLKLQISEQPAIGVVLGSGLSGLSKKMDVQNSFLTSEIPEFPESTVVGHEGKLLFGKLGGKNVMLSSGRVHFYEGYPMTKVTLGIRVMAYLGCKTVILTNAVGGVREDLQPGDLVTVTDHINMMGANPLRGPHDERFGARFPDLTQLYTPSLIDLAHNAAHSLDIPLKKAVLTATPGPTYESPAEVKMIKQLGGDLVGMSVVPEAIVGSQNSMDVLAISCVTNLAAGISGEPLNHKEVIEVSNKIANNFQLLVETIIESI